MHPNRLLPLVLMLSACGNRTEPAIEADPMLQAGWTGRTQPREIIRARFEMMSRIETLMLPIDAIQIEPVKDPEQLRTNARVISAMLLAMPHLFPPTTNLYKPEGPEYPTLALPAIWKNFDTFNKLALAASRTAAEMGETADTMALQAAGAKLQASCDACHALFVRRYVPQKPQASDYEFDFDAAIANDHE